MFKKIILFILLSTLLLACRLPVDLAKPKETQPPPQITLPPTEAPVPLPVEPTTEVLPPTATEPPGTVYSFGGITSTVPACLSVTLISQVEPAQPYDANSYMMDFWPQHSKLDLSGYPLSGKFFEPVIRVYPVADFVAMEEGIQERVTNLQNLLAAMPAQPADAIPSLPLFNAAQVFKTQVRYIPFQNGTGVRFLTEYAQYIAPVNNHDLIYSFQGLTSDGKYWISAILPVNLPYLQESYDSPNIPADGIPMPSFDSATFDADLQTYYQTLFTRMDQTTNSTFLPDLDCLDSFIQSFSIE